MEVDIAVVAAAGDEDYARVAIAVDGFTEQRCAVKGAEGVHTPAAVDDKSFAFLIGNTLHPGHLVQPRCLVQIPRAKYKLGFRSLSYDVSCSCTVTAADAGHVRAVRAVAI